VVGGVVDDRSNVVNDCCCQGEKHSGTIVGSVENGLDFASIACASTEGEEGIYNTICSVLRKFTAWVMLGETWTIVPLLLTAVRFPN
jgi:hypothetical protein